MNAPRPRFRTLVIAGAAVAGAAAFTAVGGARTAATPPSNTAAPTVSGTAALGHVLTASAGSWSGTTPISFRYKWQRCDSGGAGCVSISSNANAQTYTIKSEDAGHTLRVEVTASNSGGSAKADSAVTGVVAGATPPANTGIPNISGSAVIGGTVSTGNGSWTGTAPITYTYQWRRCDSSGSSCGNISGGTSKSYTVAEADLSHTIRVVVTATNAGGSGQATSPATGVIAVTTPANTVKPTVSGTVEQGQKLTATNGTWTGGGTIAYTFQWWRCNTDGSNCSAISGATSGTYTLTSSDVGKAVRVIVTAKNSAGSATSNSELTAAVKGTGATTTTTAPPPSGVVRLPNGEYSIAASSVPDTDRLTISSVKVSPAAITGRQPVTITFKVIENSKYDVNGALVYVLGLPYGWAPKMAEAATGADGTVSIPVSVTSKAPKKGALVLFVRARTPKGSLLAGSSTRRLIQVKIRP